MKIKNYRIRKINRSADYYFQTKKHKPMSTTLEEKLENEARFLRISIPYDKRDKYTMVSFDDGIMSELECDESFVPPMYDESTKLLEFWIDLRERKLKDWDESNGYLHVWAKVRDEGAYTLYDTDMKPLWQIQGYVPSALIPPYDMGFGDYLELTIEADGTLPEWQETSDFSDFLVSGREPGPVMSYRWNHAATAYYDVLGYKLDKEEVIWLVQRLMGKYSISVEEIAKNIL